MKQHENMTGVLTYGSLLRQTSHMLIAFIGDQASGIRKGWSNLLKNLQVGRMETVLRSMSDEQLKLAGVERSNIEQHARFLVTYEYDGL